MEIYMFNTEDTIVAPATAVGIGAISIIRISGTRSLEFILRSFQSVCSNSELKSHVFTYGSIMNSHANVIDHVMVVFMRAPSSFTREDVVEIHCHSNPFIVRHIIELFVEMGCRLAEAGEFTYRAFMHGRINLSEAEAIAELIEAGSSVSARIAVEHLEGSISTFASKLNEQLLHMAAMVEAYLDFPEEEVDHVHINTLAAKTDSLLVELNNILSTFYTGKVMREGLSILILGEPNVGKSSLLNYLLGYDRAIVTDIPGTTRDFIEEQITLGHLPIKIVDTAGLRDSEDVIEQTGVQRARDKARKVDLILYVVDGSEEKISFNASDDIFANEIPVILVINKADKYACKYFDFDLPFVSISALTGFGIDSLKEKIEQEFKIPSVYSGGILTEKRHYDIFNQVKREITSFQNGLNNDLPGELLACHIYSSMNSIGRITGETVPDDVLNEIFSKFCVGK